MNPIPPIDTVARLIAFAVGLQTIEILMIQPSLKNNGVWTWQLVRADFDFFPKVIRRFFEITLKHPNFIYVMCFQMIAAISLLILPTGLATFCLLATTTLCCLRWRGTFNGGSDFMTLVVLSATSFALTFKLSPKIVNASLWYIAIQTCTSYFNAGFIKLKTKNWRNGLALNGFLASAIYSTQSPLDRFLRSESVTKIASWSVMLMECSFPIALISPEICRIYLGVFFVFHLANFYIFGLNRFLFAWLSTYPALYYCSQKLIY